MTMSQATTKKCSRTCTKYQAMARTKANDTIYTPAYNYWLQVERAKEVRRWNDLKQGKPAKKGYWKDNNNKPVQTDAPDTFNDIPPREYLNDYRLEVTHRQANQLIKEGAERINMIVNTLNGWKLTYKNALKLPNWHFIKDINGRWCLFKNRYFYKII